MILVGSADAVSGTGRPHAYFRKHFERGAPWTFVVQNGVPHCCMINAKALMLAWLEAVVVERRTRAVGSYGYIETMPSVATGCPGQTPPLRQSWCLSTKDTWGGANWSVRSAALGESPRPPRDMIPAGWMPRESLAKQWLAFVTRPEHPVVLPP